MLTEVHIGVGGDKGDARADAAGPMIEAVEDVKASTTALIGCRY